MSEYVLDASALLALLNAEEGREKVSDLLSESVISSVNLAEVITRLSALGMPEIEIRETLRVLGLDVIEFNEEQAFDTGILVQSTKPFGLSLGDRACLALALYSERVVLTADRPWKDLDLGVEIHLIR